MAVGKKAFGFAAQALCLMASVEAAQGACLVLKGGATIDVKTAPQAKGALVVFQDANGRLASMRGTEVDMAATDDANARGVCGRPAGVNVWDSSRPVPIQAPVEPAVQAPTAAAILSGMPASAGPPKGLRIDCGTVECGKALAPNLQNGAGILRRHPPVKDPAHNPLKPPTKNPPQG